MSSAAYIGSLTVTVDGVRHCARLSILVENEITVLDLAHDLDISHPAVASFVAEHGITLGAGIQISEAVQIIIDLLDEKETHPVIHYLDADLPIIQELHKPLAQMLAPAVFSGVELNSTPEDCVQGTERSIVKAHALKRLYTQAIDASLITPVIHKITGEIDNDILVSIKIHGPLMSEQWSGNTTILQMGLLGVSGLLPHITLEFADDAGGTAAKELMGMIRPEYDGRA